MKPDYTEFDNALLDLIANGCNTMMALDSKPSGLPALAEPFARLSNNPTSRIIDRRLQALRKKGAVRFSGKVWVRLGALGQPV
jgi:hypothetical protein